MAINLKEVAEGLIGKKMARTKDETIDSEPKRKAAEYIDKAIEILKDAEIDPKEFIGNFISEMPNMVEEPEESSEEEMPSKKPAAAMIALILKKKRGK